MKTVMYRDKNLLLGLKQQIKNFIRKIEWVGHGSKIKQNEK